MNAASEIETLSKQYGEAHRKSDVAFLEDVLADEWTLIAARGKVKHKLEYLKELKNGTLKIEAINDSEVTCRVYGDSAILSGRRQSKVIFEQRDASDVTRFSQFYVRQEGKWRCVATHVTSIA